MNLDVVSSSYSLPRVRDWDLVDPAKYRNLNKLIVLQSGRISRGLLEGTTTAAGESDSEEHYKSELAVTRARSLDGAAIKSNLDVAFLKRFACFS